MQSISKLSDNQAQSPPPSCAADGTVDGRSLSSGDRPKAARALEGLRVALFSGNYNYVQDGANQALNRLVRHLEDESGANVRVYSPVTSTPAFEPQGTLIPVPSVPFPGRREYRIALGLPSQVRNDVERFQPHILHLSAPDWLGTGAQRLGKRLGIPVISSLHTRFETYFAYYGLGWIRRAVERRQARFYSESDFALVPTASMAAEMARSLGSDKVRLWGRGVDAALFHPQRRSMAWRAAHGIDNNEIALVFFGRLVLEKGVGIYADVVSRLQGQGFRVRPLIIGAGPAEERLRKALSNSIFTGHLRGQELATAVASGDILINPSVTEAFGNVVLEAMACGLTVVAADVPSAANLVTHERTGLLCATVTADDFASAAQRLIKSRRLRQKISAAARAAAMGHDWPTALDSVVDVYREALARKH